MLGYQKFRNEWRTPYELKKLRAGMVFSDKFGWLAKKYLTKYEAGQRYSRGHWISAEEDALDHHDINTGWDVETEHYAIRTDHSIEAAIGLSGKLENLSRLWQEIFLPFYASEANVVALFEGRGKRNPAPTAHRKIVYFRDRADYLETLKAAPRLRLLPACTLAVRRRHTSTPILRRTTTARCTTKPRTSCSTSHAK